MHRSIEASMPNSFRGDPDTFILSKFSNVDSLIKPKNSVYATASPERFFPINGR